MIKGSLVAIVTPFSNNKIDELSLRELVEFQLKSGTHGIVGCGTTGETPTLSPQEWERVIRIIVEQTRGRAWVIAGAGSNNTSQAVEKAKKAKELGVDAVLSVTPYYNKPTPHGVYAHFKEVARTQIPVIMYNVPSRTGISMDAEGVAELSRLENIMGIKEATGNMKLCSEIIEHTHKNFCVYSGDDFTAFPLYTLGGKGVISAVANVIPREMAELWNKFEAGDIKTARTLHYKIQPLCRALFGETNPIPVKAALSMMGKIKNELRLPLVPMSKEKKIKLRKIMQQF